jgi:hypothetical protein
MNKLPPPNVSAAAQAVFHKNHALIIDTTVARLLSVPHQFELLGDRAEHVLTSGFEFTSATLEACLQINDVSLLLDQMKWSKDRLPHDGISMEQMAKNLQVYCDVIGEILPETHANEIITVIRQCLVI